MSLAQSQQSAPKLGWKIRSQGQLWLPVVAISKFLCLGYKWMVNNNIYCDPQTTVIVEGLFRAISRQTIIGPSVLRAPAEQTKVATILGN